MALHLVTGYAGEEHITSVDQGAYNMATFGEGEYVLNRGNKFEATVVSNNLITVADGEAMMQGRFVKMIMGTSEEVTIENGTQNMNRRDLICLRYEKNSTTGIETASMVVKKGTETSGTPADPEYTQGDITDGQDLVNEMPLYRVTLEGLNITSVTQLFAVKTNLVDYMDDYSLPVASKTQTGGIRIPDNSGLEVYNNNGDIRLRSNPALGFKTTINYNLSDPPSRYIFTGSIHWKKVLYYTFYNRNSFNVPSGWSWQHYMYFDINNSDFIKDNKTQQRLWLGRIPMILKNNSIPSPGVVFIPIHQNIRDLMTGLYPTDTKATIMFNGLAFNPSSSTVLINANDTLHVPIEVYDENT